jgi:hypothetical protein
MLTVTDDDLLDRAAERKAELVAFAWHMPWISKRLVKELHRQFGDPIDTDEMHLINAIDQFVLQERLPDGRTVVEHFVAAHRELDELDREMLLGWHDVVEGIFEVVANTDSSVDAVNVIDQLRYRLHATSGPSVIAAARSGAFLLARAVPLGDAWMLSGAQMIMPKSDRKQLLQVAAEMATSRPRLVFRNPELLARAWELQHWERDRFVEFFGADLVVLAGTELQPRWDGYWAWRLRQRPPQAAPTTTKQRGRQPVQPLARWELPPELCDADTIGIVYDEAEGLTFLPDFGQLQAVFDDPGQALDKAHRQVVQHYLRDDTVSALPFRRLAAGCPEGATLVFRRLLSKPSFLWERDGESLLRKYKPASFATPPLPCVTVLGDELARALQAA